jgi:hypothetical protein
MAGKAVQEKQKSKEVQVASPERFAIEMNLRGRRNGSRLSTRLWSWPDVRLPRKSLPSLRSTPVLPLSNWTGSLGSPATGTRVAVSPGEFGSTASASGAATQASVWNAITGRKTGQDVWLSNNLPYVNDLNIGKITPRSSPAPDRTPYPRFAERAVLLELLPSLPTPERFSNNGYQHTAHQSSV